MEKIKFSHSKLIARIAFAGAVLVAPLAQAVEVTVQGFIRQEMAYKYTNDENQLNRGGGKFDGHTQPFTGITAASFPPGFGNIPKADRSKDNDWNLFGTKAEIDIGLNFNSELSGFVKLRGYYMWDVFSNVEDSGEADDEYGNKVNHFNVNNHGKEATYLSFSDNEYMIDVPAMYLDWTKGKWWVRVGQQQIAWGEALFFRVQDVANGLDLRRHVFFDLGAEEYADERMSAPGIRASYVLSRNWEVEVFAQMFQPSVLPTNNSPLNVIANGFNPNYEEGYDKTQDNINAGIRFSGQFDQLGVQLFAVSRHDPNPIFDLLPSGKMSAGGAFGPGFETQPFVYQSGGFGAASAAEWFYLSQVGGIDGISVLNNLIDDYPFIKAIATAPIHLGGFAMAPDGNGEYLTTIRAGGHNMMVTTVPLPGPIPAGTPLDPDGLDGYDFLSAFFGAPYAPTFPSTDGITPNHTLTGQINAHYASENIFGFGVNYIFYAEPDTLLDQMVVRFEASVTPDKKFTNNLSRNFIEEDEYLVSLVVEKYHRFSDAFPATFFIFEWMYRSETDLLGRHLSGIGGTATNRPGGGEQDRGWNGLVFAFQQPSPTLKWRFDFSALYDDQGGFFLQPAVRYKPNNDWIVETFVNIVDGNPDSVFQPYDYMDDITVRLTYQF